MHSARLVIKPCQSPIRVYLSTSLHWLLLPVRLWPSADWRVGCLAAASFTSPVWCALWCERVGSESMCMCTWCVATACQLKRLQVPLILRRGSQEDNAALPLTNLKRHVHLGGANWAIWVLFCMRRKVVAAGERRGQEEGITKAFPYSNRRWV